MDGWVGGWVDGWMRIWKPGPHYFCLADFLEKRVVLEVILHPLEEIWNVRYTVHQALWTRSAEVGSLAWNLAAVKFVTRACSQ